MHRFSLRWISYLPGVYWIHRMYRGTRCVLNSHRMYRGTRCVLNSHRMYRGTSWWQMVLTGICSMNSLWCQQKDKMKLYVYFICHENLHTIELFGPWVTLPPYPTPSLVCLHYTPLHLSSVSTIPHSISPLSSLYPTSSLVCLHYTPLHLCSVFTTPHSISPLSSLYPTPSLLCLHYTNSISPLPSWLPTHNPTNVHEEAEVKFEWTTFNKRVYEVEHSQLHNRNIFSKLWLRRTFGCLHWFLLSAT